MNYHDSNHNCCTPCTFKCSTGSTGITGPTGPTGPTGTISNASFDGIINTQKIAEPQVAVLLDSATVSNNITYNYSFRNRTILVLELLLALDNRLTLKSEEHHLHLKLFFQSLLERMLILALL